MEQHKLRRRRRGAGAFAPANGGAAFALCYLFEEKEGMRGYFLAFVGVRSVGVVADSLAAVGIACQEDFGGEFFMFFHKLVLQIF